MTNYIRYKPLFSAFIISIIAFVIHKSIFLLFLPTFEKDFVYTNLFLYGVFSLFTILILFILIQVKQKNIDNVGYTFLLLTSIKMAVTFYFMQPILKSNAVNINVEKGNFFVVFILFLVIETVVTIRLLNNKQ